METTFQEPTAPATAGEDTFLFPASFGQRRLWFLHQYAPASSAYNIPTAHRLSGPLNVPALHAALDEIRRRHEALRTTFRLHDGEVQQVVEPVSAWPLQIVTLGAKPGVSTETEWRRLMEEEAKRPFDLAGGPLARALLIRLAAVEHVLVVVFHHIVCDGWSIGVFHRELGRLYDSFAANQTPSQPDLPIQYADYAVWQREWLQGEALADRLHYWTAQLAGAPPFLDFPTDHPRPATESFRGNRVAATLSATLTGALQALARREGVTLFQLLLAALKTLLSRYCRQEDLVIGSPVAARTRTETEELIGFFVNTLALRTDLSGDPPFRELLQRVKVATLAAYAHQDLPFERLVEELQLPRDTGRTPLIQVMFAMQNLGDRRLQLSGLRVEPVDVHPAATSFDLTWYVYENHGGLEFRLDYSTDLFEAASMRRLLDHWRVMLEGIVAKPETRLSELPLLTETERHRLLIEWNQTARPYPRDRCVHELFEEQAQARPNAPAVCLGEVTWSYGELDRCAEKIAAHLQSLGVVPDQLVGFCVERSPEMVAVLLGILKAGGAYLPMDAALPDERLALMVSAARPAVLIAQSDNLGRFRLLAIRDDGGAGQSSPAVITIEELLSRECHSRMGSTGNLPVPPGYQPGGMAEAQSLPNWTAPFDSVSFPFRSAGCRPEQAGSLFHPAAGQSCEAAGPVPASAAKPRSRPVVGPEHLAYVMYTSGSTGRPKGVMVPHRGVVRLAKNADYACLSAEETLLQLAPLSFDASTFEIWGALLNGGRLALMPPGPPTPPVIGEAIRQHGVTTLWLTSALFDLMVEERLADLQPLRQLLTGGDVLSPRHVARALQRLPGCRLINGYGPTENTTFTCCHTISREADGSRPIPIGRPIANTRVFVLDPHLQPVPVGVPGELCTSGDGLARGYLGDPELTREQFVPDPFSTVPGARLYRTGDLVSYRVDGTLNFLGRLDRQVKIRGFRVEPEEVEAVLLDCPGVKEAAVVVREISGERQLVGYVVAASESERPTEFWRDYLRKRLPDYMIPSTIVRLDDFPRSPNGKVDRAALPPPSAPEGRGAKVMADPANLLELKLLRIWQRLFGRSDIRKQDNFFDLGGHSLMAARLAAEVERLLGRGMPIASLFQAPSVESLARMLQDADWLPTWTSLVPLQSRGSRPPIFFVHGADGDVFTFIELTRLLGPDQPVYGLQAVGMDGLRPRHTSVEEMAAHYVKEIRSFQPDGPYYLGGYSMGGWIAWEVSQQLHRQGQQVAMLALVDTQASCRLPLIMRLPMVLPQLMRRFGFHLRRCLQMPPRGWVAYFKGRLAALRFHLWRILPPAPVPGFPSAPSTHADTGRAGDHYEKLAFRYRPSAYAGTVDLFQCEDASPYGLMAFQRLVVGGVHVHSVAGNHYTMIDQEHVSGLAAGFRQALRAAQERARNGN